MKRYVSQIIRKVNQNLLKEIENSIVQQHKLNTIGQNKTKDNMKDMSSSTLHHKLKKQC